MKHESKMEHLVVVCACRSATRQLQTGQIYMRSSPMQHLIFWQNCNDSDRDASSGPLMYEGPVTYRRHFSVMHRYSKRSHLCHIERTIFFLSLCLDACPYILAWRPVKTSPLLISLGKNILRKTMILHGPMEQMSLHHKGETSAAFSVPQHPVSKDAYCPVCTFA